MTANACVSSARAGSRTLWQILASGGEPEPLTTGAGEDDAPDLFADGTRLVFTNVRNSWRLVLAEPSGAEQTLLERRSELLFPMFSPNGARIAFFGRAERAVAIFTIARDGTDLRQLTSGPEMTYRGGHTRQHVWCYQRRRARPRSDSSARRSKHQVIHGGQTKRVQSPRWRRMVNARNAMGSGHRQPEATMCTKWRRTRTELPQPLSRAGFR